MGDFEIDDFVLEPTLGVLDRFHVTSLLVQSSLPFPKSAHAVFQFSSSLVTRVCDRQHIHVGEGMADQCSQVFGKCSKCVVTAFESMNEHEEQSLPHSRQLSCTEGASSLKWTHMCRESIMLAMEDKHLSLSRLSM